MVGDLGSQNIFQPSIAKHAKEKRLKDEVQNVLVKGKSISEVTSMAIQESLDFFKVCSGNQKLIAEELLKEIKDRLRFLVNVGLNYLSLDRHGPSLSGGEAQRIRLASQIGRNLLGFFIY